MTSPATRSEVPIGRSPKDTLRSYVEARADGDYEQVVEFLTEAVWSGDGALSREEFVACCTELPQAVRASTPTP